MFIKVVTNYAISWLLVKIDMKFNHSLVVTNLINNWLPFYQTTILLLVNVVTILVIQKERYF